MFRRRFLAEKEILSAALEITALGVYEAELNGRRVGDFVLAPGWTSYDHRLQVQTYDVTELLIGAPFGGAVASATEGVNELRVTLGRGIEVFCERDAVYLEGAWHELPQSPAGAQAGAHGNSGPHAQGRDRFGGGYCVGNRFFGSNQLLPGLRRDSH